MVAGLAAAKSNNYLGIRGLDWNAQIISKNISDANGNYIGDAAVAQKIIDAVNDGAKVLNRSGSSQNYSSILAMGYAYAYKMNRVTVASMGNTGIQEIRYPAALPNVIAVGSTKNDDAISSFSTTGNHIDVVAPGGSGYGNGTDILSTSINNTYVYAHGTSLSAPLVSGLASLMIGYKPNLSNDDIRQIIRLSAEKKDTSRFNIAYGYGRINAGRAMSYLTHPYAIVQNTASSGTIVNTSDQFVTQFISATGLSTGNYLVKRIEIQKTISLPENLYNIIGVWGRGVFTTGWSMANPNFGEGFCEVVPGSLTSNNVTLRSYVYQVWDISGSYLGYFPSSPSDVTFAYSVLGYEKPTISGPTQICNQATYTINNFPQGATVNWSTSNDLSVTSDQNTATVNIARTFNLALNTYIRATITINGFSFIIEKTGIQIGTVNPLIKIYDARGRYELAPPYYTNMAYTIVAYGDTFSTNPFNYQWVVNQPVELGEPPLLFNGKQFSFIADSVGSYNFSLQYNGECGWSLPTSKAVYFYQNNMLLSFYPNPATDLLTVSVGYEEESINESDILTKKTIYNESYCVELWHEKYGKVKSVVSNESIVQIHLQDLPRGLYAIHLKVKNKIIRKKLLQLM